MKQKNFFQRMVMPIPELSDYYRARRVEKHYANEPVRWIRLRKVLHWPIIFCLKLYHKVCKCKLRVLYNKAMPSKRPTIYAAIHICWDDIEYIFDAITEHAYLLLGDPDELYKSFDGAALFANGVVCMDTDNKVDRQIGLESCIKLLKAGQNILIFPEGVWNTSENKLVLPLYPGTAIMAIQTGADIVPIAIERSGAGFDVAIGKRIRTQSYKEEDKWILTNYLRDSMATLKWDVLEASGISKRSKIPINASELFEQEILKDARGIADWIGFKEQEFHPKNITEYEKAFEFMKRIEIKKQNAFLFRREK